VLMATLFGPLACEQVDPSKQSIRGTTDPAVAHDATMGHLHESYDRGEHDGKEKPPPTCCVEFKPREGCVTLVNQLREGSSSFSDMATATLGVVAAVTKAFRHALDPTRADALLLRSLRGQKVEDVIGRLGERQMSFEVVDAPEEDLPGNPIDVLSAHLLQTEADPLIAFRRNGVIVDVRQQALHDRVARLEREIAILRGGTTDKAGDEAKANGKSAQANGKSAQAKARRKRGMP